MSAAWIYTKRPDKNKKYIFKKTFKADGEVLSFKISANSRYRLYINGEFICEGPCATDALHKCYEEGSVALKKGENTLIAEILYITENFISINSGDEPSLYFEGKYGENELASDESFLVCEDTATSFVPSKYTLFIHSSEIFEPAKRRLDFKNAEILYIPHENSYSRFGVLDRYNLRKRPIPAMKYEEPEGFTVTRSSLDLKGEFVSLKADKDFFVELDAGRYTTYFPRIVLKANEGARIRIIYSEAYYTDISTEDIAENIGVKEDRCDANGILGGYSDLIISDGNEITFTPYWFRSGRFIRIEGENIKDIEIKEMSFRFYHYDINVINDFKCSDEEYNKMWEISLNTLKCCMQETYVDCPYYEQQQYLMDASLSMLYTFCITDDKRMIEKSIDEMSAETGPEGLLYSTYPTRGLQVIPGFDIFFIYMLRNYLMYSADERFVKKHLGNVEKVISYFDSKLTPEGYVGATGYWPFVDWGRGWDIGIPGSDPRKPLTYYSLLYSNGLKWAQEIFTFCGRENTAKDFEAKRLSLNEAINKHCFKNGLYTDSPGSDGVSQHCQIMAILGDVCENSEELFKRLEDTDLTECSFSFSHFLLRIYEKCNRYDLADKLFDKWRIMIKNNMTTWGESPDWTRSECHAWSSVMLYEFPAAVLGVKPAAGGFKKVSIAPYTGGLSFASGSIPTPYGIIRVEFEKTDGKTVFKVNSPAEIVKLIKNKEYTDTYLELEL